MVALALAPLLFAAGIVGVAGVGDVVSVVVSVGMVGAAGVVSLPVATENGGDPAASDDSAVMFSPSFCRFPGGMGGASSGLPVHALVI